MVSLKAVMSSEKNTEMEQNVFVRKETIKDEEETVRNVMKNHKIVASGGIYAK